MGTRAIQRKTGEDNYENQKLGDNITIESRKWGLGNQI